MEKFRFGKDGWLKFGCFLTGYNYKILSESSEASKQYIKKLTSALIIIISIWSMVGYMFASRYAGANNYYSLLGAVMSGIIIVQIERQIILGGKIRFRTILFRLLLGLIVAIIGALILDQVFFKNDIAKKKEDLLIKRIQDRVQDVKNNASDIIAINMRYIDSLRTKIESNNEIAAKAGFRIQTGNITTTTKTSGEVIGGSPEIKTTQQKSYQSHPKLEENNALRSQIKIYDSYITTERDSLFSRIERAKSLARNEPPGFLDELTIIVELATQSGIALFAYLIFLLFFIFIELFIVLAKMNDGDNDYHRLVHYQERIREERLKVLEKKRTASLGEDDKIDSSELLINNSPK
jgi:hypothetical protein